MPEHDSPPVAIVTGGSSGVGRQTGRLLAAAGYAVALAARSEDKLDEAVAEAQADAADGARVIAVPTDVTDPDAVDRLIERVIDELGGLHALCNVAGDAPLCPIHAIEPDAWRRCVDVNLSAIVYTTRAAWEPLKKQGGTIVNVSSMASIDPFKGFAMYAAAKVGVNMFTKATADEGSNAGIKAVCLAPGAIETPMLRANFSENAIPRANALDPADLAQIIVDLITGARDYQSGETLVVESPH
jgi:NAD(P)-dependent dehydrogenase (short-subunit alcohol dehydrogenase family)